MARLTDFRCQQARHDALPKVGFARMVVHSVMLYTISLHVTRIVWPDCKPPWPIKGWGGPLAVKRRTTKREHQHAHCLYHDIGTCLNQTSGT
jgi:hypothetical protein